MAECTLFRHTAPENEIRIVLIGKPGVGKSRTGNSIIGSTRFRYGQDCETTCCSLQTEERFGRKLDVVDTPGNFDTKKSSVNVKKEIFRCMAMTSPSPHALLFCVKMGQFNNEDLDTFKHFLKYFGEDFLKYTIVVFTHLDHWEESIYDRGGIVTSQQHEQYVNNLHQPLKTFLALCGNQFLFVNNRLYGSQCEIMAREIIEKIETLIFTNNKKCFINSDYQMVEEALQEETRKSHKDRQSVKTGSLLYTIISKRIKSELHAINLF